jgi:hypothetical protein
MKVTPFGGPASGLWPTGTAAPSPGPRVLAQGVKPVSCTVASILAQCFVGCNLPGNCGWTIDTPAGTVTFTGLVMKMGPFGANVLGEAARTLPGVPTLNITIQFKLTEIAGVPTGNMNYSVTTYDPLGARAQHFALSGSGGLLVVIDNQEWIGTWTPLGNNTQRNVHLSVALGIPTLTIDGVNIPLALGAVLPIPGGVPNSLIVRIQNNDTLDQGSYDSLFITNGPTPASTVFCCP